MPSAKAQTKTKVRVSASAKDTITTRTDTGKVIGTNAPNSTILQQNGDVKQAQANLVATNDKLDAKDKKVKALEIQLATEKGALLNLIVDWDGFYDVFVSTARLYCLTDEDAKGLGLPAAGVPTYALATPLAVTARWDVKTGLIRIHVKRAPGLRSVRIEISPDPMTATSFKELEGDGATAALAGPLDV